MLSSKMIMVIGGINIDIKASPRVPLQRGTSNPARMTFSAGGVARNIAHVIGLLGGEVALAGAVGDDAWGTSVLADTARAGVDTSRVKICRGKTTDIYFAVLAPGGDLDTAVSSMDRVQEADTAYITSIAESIRSCSHIIVDLNLERETLGSIARLKAEGGALLAAEPVSVAKAEKLLGLPCPADLITPNLDELTALAGYPVHTAGDMETACRGLSARFNHILVTLGREGAYHFDAAAGRGKRYPAYKAEITDATGAGDSFTGGVVYALAAGFSMDECIRTGMAAAVLSLESEQTVCGGISLESVRDIMKTRRVLP